jgi:hypothetical protein
MATDAQDDQINTVRDRIFGELIVGLTSQQLRPWGAARIGLPWYHISKLLIDLFTEGVLILTPPRP